MSVSIIWWKTPVTACPDNSILHRDLKSPNILLTELRGAQQSMTDPYAALTSKICDFGISHQGNLVSNVGVSGTYRWMSPEVMKGDPVTMKVSIRLCRHSFAHIGQTDVYSFAMVVYELFRQKLPFGNTNIGAIVYNVVKNGARPNLSKRFPPDVIQLVTMCWAA